MKQVYKNAHVEFRHYILKVSILIWVDRQSYTAAGVMEKKCRQKHRTKQRARGGTTAYIYIKRPRGVRIAVENSRQ